MAEPSKEVLAQHVRAMLKGENLDLWTARKVREKLQGKFNLNLKPRKQDIISICQQVVNESSSESDSGGDSDSDREYNANGKRVKKKQSPASRSKGKSTPKRQSTAKKSKVKKEPVSPKKKANAYSGSSDEAGGDGKSTSSYSGPSDQNEESDEEENNDSFNNSFSNNDSQDNSQSISSQQKLTSTTISNYSSNMAPGLSGTSSAGNSDSDKSNHASDSDSDRNRVDDAEIARRLQEEEYKRSQRATRSGNSQNGKSKSKSKSKSSKKSKKNGHSNDDSDDGGSSGKKGWAPIPLSPEMAEFTGKSEMTRHEVVKYIYDYCKQNDLQDPKNKQFAICDDDLYKLIGVKRFRMFGMIRLFTKHFLRDS